MAIGKLLTSKHKCPHLAKCGHLQEKPAVGGLDGKPILGVEFDARIRHRTGDTTVRVRPRDSRHIGLFTFDEGTDGFVEILAGDSKVQVIADAVAFALRGGAGKR